MGDAWADLCASWVDKLPGTLEHTPPDGGEPFAIERVVRLDDLPGIAATASKAGLQNPDLLIVGNRAGHTVLQAADAKFSVETARAKQVSPAVVSALIDLGSLVRSLIGESTEEIEFVPGVFLTPDFPLTHAMLGGRFGITRATVASNEVMLVPVDGVGFFSNLPSAATMRILAEVDALPVDVDSSLLAGLYYFRLARSAAGAWLDSQRPLLLFNDRIDVDDESLMREAAKRALESDNAFDLTIAWDADVEAIRLRRKAVDQVTELPVVARDLREAIAKATGGKPELGPSINQLRRRLGSWFRGELRAAAGPMLPSEPNFSARLQEVGKLSAELSQQVPEAIARTIQELIAERHVHETTTPYS